MFKAYQEYKSSDLIWTSSLPKFWEEKRISTFFIYKEDNIGNKWKTTQLLSLTKNGVIKKDINSGKGKSHSDYSTYQKIEKNDFIFCLFDIDETPRTVGLSSIEGMITSAYTAFIPQKNIDNRFMYYLFEHIDDKKALKPFYSGMRKTIKSSDFLKLKVQFPPKQEQTQIATFLDQETQKIAHLISKQEKLIKLLEEQRKSITSYAVTKGINLNAEMKESGVEWLGEVPKDWNVTRFSSIFEENKRKNKGMIENNLLSLSYGRIIEKDINNAKGLVPENFDTYQIIYPNDIIFRFTDLQNDKRSLRSAYSTFKGIITSAYISVSSQKEINIEFYHYLFRTYDLMKVFYSMGDGMRQSLKIDELNKMLILIPSIEEQNKIVEFINNENTKINHLIQKQTTLIEKLKEYRASIISHAVTGKIDVRNLI